MLRLVIDGYNLIGSREGVSGDIEAKRKSLLGTLARYHRLRRIPITVVFDGWGSEWDMEHEEVYGPLSVIFSRRGERADSVIARLAARMGAACIVVSSDREVRRATVASGGTAIECAEFESKMRAALSAGRGEPPEVSGDEEDARPARGDPPPKKGNPYRRSKASRRRVARLKKL